MKNIFTILVLAIIFSSTAITVKAQTCLPLTAGCLDTTFGSGGKVLLPLPENSSSSSHSAVQSDGKIVVITETNGKHRLFRLNADGSIDTTFGSGGSVYFFWGFTKGNTTYWGNANGIAIQNVNGSERIVIAGQCPLQSGTKILSSRLRVDRFMSDGTPDASFGTNGTAALDVGSAYTIAVQPSDQKLLTVGTSYGELVRLNVNGTLDTTFGTGGKVNSGNGQQLAVDSGGEILMGLLYITGRNNQQQSFVSVKKFKPNGTLDTSFGTNGLTVGFSTPTRIFSMRIDPFGNILIGGTTVASNRDFAVQRFTPTGIPDNSFSGDSKAIFDFAGLSDSGASVLVQSDGKVIMSGNAALIAGSNYQEFAFVRFNYDGSLDTSFGNGGKTTFDINGNNYLRDANIQIDPLCGCEKFVGSGATYQNLTFARIHAF